MSEQVGTNGGLSQRWRAFGANTYGDSRHAGKAKEECADELDAAKLRIEEAVKALTTFHMTIEDYGGPTCVERVAVLKIIREIL